MITENEETVDQTVQQDWSLVWNLFDDPHQLLITPGSLPKGMQDMVRNAVTEMRRYYSRKVVDVLIKVTRSSLDVIRKRFIREIDPGAFLFNKIWITSAEVLYELIIVLRTDETPSPIFLLHATLMIPVVTVKPSLDDVQEVLTLVGKTIAGVARGVSQWNSRINKVHSCDIYICFKKQVTMRHFRFIKNSN